MFQRHLNTLRDIYISSFPAIDKIVQHLGHNSFQFYIFKFLLLWTTFSFFSSECCIFEETEPHSRTKMFFACLKAEARFSPLILCLFIFMLYVQFCEND